MLVGMNRNPPPLEDLIAALLGRDNRPALRRNYLSDGMFDQRPALPPSGLRNVFGQAPIPTLPPSGLGNVFALTRPPAQSALSGLFQPPPPPRQTPNPDYSNPFAAAKQRWVFYSFHYDDVNRVNVVRQSGKIRPTDKMRCRTARDRSIWENAKRTGELALKRLINKGMIGSSVTCVLAGTYTWSREWVRYEIARSLIVGNGLLTVYIDQVRCMNTGLARRGQNPLDYMAIGLDAQGRPRIYENVGGQWVLYSRLQVPLPHWPGWLYKPPVGYVQPLSSGASAYDYVAGDGYTHLLLWTDAAAKAAGR